jgi:hypothetical protein
MEALALNYKKRESKAGTNDQIDYLQLANKFKENP